VVKCYLVTFFNRNVAAAEDAFQRAEAFDADEAGSDEGLLQLSLPYFRLYVESL
jgi:hypothetical protein